jgi:hypothetical protein
MAQGMIIQGRSITADEIGLIRGLMAEYPDWGRTRLSEELCRCWNWRNSQGRIKDMAARTLLLKLERRGFIELPARQRPSTNEFRNRRVPAVDYTSEPIRSSLSDLRPLSVRVIAPRSTDLRLFKCLVARYHYLGHRILGLIARRIRGDWQVKYGHPVHALETFVDRSRFRGTCYRAANWLRLGVTRGRTRNDWDRRIQASVKDVYLYPLIPDFRRELCAPACSRTEGRASK